MNLVPFAPSGLVIALQYWSGDERQAMRLARLIADIEPEKRTDVALAFCRRFDMPTSQLQADTFEYCSRKFGMIGVTSPVEATGHPDGCWGLWSGTMEFLAGAWWRGELAVENVFTVEPDGVPLRRDWIDRLRAEHAAALSAGKRVTGCLTATGGALPHINGSLMAHLSLWVDRTSLQHTPAGQAWDLFHSVVLTSEARPTSWIRNIYGAREWSDSALKAMSKEVAWLASTKDDSAIAWAERNLPPTADKGLDAWMCSCGSLNGPARDVCRACGDPP
jgi:hypothetical protein